MLIRAANDLPLPSRFGQGFQSVQEIFVNFSDTPACVGTVDNQA
jgi:hypothetical protein